MAGALFALQFFADVPKVRKDICSVRTTSLCYGLKMESQLGIHDAEQDRKYWKLGVWDGNIGERVCERIDG